MDAALKEEDEDNLPPSASPLSELSLVKVSQHRHTRSRSRGSIGPNCGGRKTLEVMDFVNPFSEAALAEYEAGE